MIVRRIIQAQKQTARSADVAREKKFDKIIHVFKSPGKQAFLSGMMEFYETLNH